MLVEFEMTVIAQSAAAVKRSFTTHGVTTAMVRALFLKFLAEHFFGQEWDTPDANELLKFSLTWIPKILTNKSRASFKIQAEFFNRIGHWRPLANVRLRSSRHNGLT